MGVWGKRTLGMQGAAHPGVILWPEINFELQQGKAVQRQETR